MSKLLTLDEVALILHDGERRWRRWSVRRRYRPDWELLADALKRVQNTNHLTEDEAKADLCRALGDGKIRVKLCVRKTARMGGDHVGHCLPGTHVSPDEFDWKRSRALEESSATIYGYEDQPVDALMISTTHVVEVLCGGIGHFTGPKAQPAKDEQRNAAEQAVDKEPEPEDAATAGSTRLLSENAAEKFTAEYVGRERKAGKRPSLSGLEAAAKEAKWRGGRSFLRAAYKRQIEVTRGRPRK
jgi:hypothetical protein